VTLRDAIAWFGSPGRTRTSDPAVNSRLLYLLSYRGTGPAYNKAGAVWEGRSRPGDGGAAVSAAPVGHEHHRNIKGLRRTTTSAARGRAGRVRQPGRWQARTVTTGLLA
jgi:hypothetical protein